MPLPRELTKKEKDNTKKVLELIPRCMTMSQTPQGEAFWMNVYDQLIILLDFRLATEVDEDDDAPAPPAPANPQPGAWLNINAEAFNAQMAQFIVHNNHGAGLAQAAGPQAHQGLGGWDHQAVGFYGADPWAPNGG